MTNTTESWTPAERAREQERKAGAILAQLARELTPQQVKLVKAYGEELAVARDFRGWDFDEQRLEALAAHFPAFGGAIRSVWWHCLESDAGNGQDCGLGLRPRAEGGPCRGVGDVGPTMTGREAGS